jgi:hypothetical protein
MQISSASGNVQCSLLHGESVLTCSVHGNMLVDMFDRDQKMLGAGSTGL